eukprot:TRINITY_DN106880_c0_g1_i1.p1 TRINITY_DN106880_c0_g1~~TRINITY_DN106880_c0_g1_i1.p1  ORF type:complete len:191 (+),score=11.61 TRINITY_DN106880_c0_g1_i1:107-679(+)
MRQPLLHGQTNVLLEQRKSKTFAPLGYLASFLAPTGLLVVGVAYMHLAKTPVEANVSWDPWPYWYQVEGKFCWTEAVLLCCMEVATFKLAAGSDDFLKFQLYREQGRAQESENMKRQLMESQSGTMIARICSALCFVWVFIFHSVWACYGIYMWLYNSGFASEKVYFGYLLGTRICLCLAAKLLQMVIKR